MAIVKILSIQGRCSFNTGPFTIQGDPKVEVNYCHIGIIIINHDSLNADVFYSSSTNAVGLDLLDAQHAT